METKSYDLNNGMDKASVDLSTGHRFGEDKQDIESVKLGLNDSTSRARIFNIGIKLATLHWTDPTIDVIEKMIDERIIEVATGKLYKVIGERKFANAQGNKIKREYYVRALNKNGASKLFKLVYSDSEVLEVEEVKQ